MLCRGINWRKLILFGFLRGCHRRLQIWKHTYVTAFIRCTQLFWQWWIFTICCFFSSFSSSFHAQSIWRYITA